MCVFTPTDRPSVDGNATTARWGKPLASTAAVVAAATTTLSAYNGYRRARARAHSLEHGEREPEPNTTARRRYYVDAVASQCSNAILLVRLFARVVIIITCAFGRYTPVCSSAFQCEILL